MAIYNKEYNELIFGQHEIIDFSNLPPALKILILPRTFNQQIKENSLPITLEVLVFGSDFNQKIRQNVLPPNLKVIVFGDFFTQKLEENTIPKNLKMLKFGFRYREIIKKNILPDTLEILDMDNYFTIQQYPTGLKKFIFRDHVYTSGEKKIFDLKVLPENIEFLDFMFCYGNLSNFNFGKLKILKIGYDHLKSIKELPSTLKYLEIYGNDSIDTVDTFDLLDCSILPLNLEYLVLTSFLTLKNNKNFDSVALLQEKLHKLKYLSIDGHKEQLNILNNLPTDLSTIKFTNLNTEIINLPINIKKIYLANNSKIQYLKKIPFDCDVINYKNNIEIIENYLINNKSSLPDSSDVIFNNIKNLDNIAMQYYFTRY